MTTPIPSLPPGIFDRLLDPANYPNAKNWDRHFFVGGRPLQSAELNEIETLLLNALASLGNTFYSEGTIVSGCSVSSVSVPVYVAISEDDVLSAAAFLTGAPVTTATVDQWNSYYRYAAFTKGYIESLSDNRLDYVYTDPSIGSTIITVDQYFQDRSTQNISLAANVYVTIADGTIFIVGRIRNVPGTTTESPIVLTGFGEETIGLKVTQSLLTADQDPTLLDPCLAPTVGSNQYNLKGADRGVLTFTWVANDPTSTVVFQFSNGSLTNSNTINTSLFLQTLAQQTYDRDGNFVVSGMTATIRANQIDSALYDLTIEPGKAYVQGYEITKAVPTILTINKATDSISVVNEAQLFQSTKLVYPLSSTPVASVSQITAQVFRLGAPVTKGPTNGSDNLVTQNIGNLVGIQSVYQIQTVGDTINTNNYVLNTDYQVIGNTIKWIGHQPAFGATYYVNLIFIKVMVPAVMTLMTVTNEQIMKTGSVIDPGEPLAEKNVLSITHVANGTDPTAPGYVEYAYGADYYLINGRTPTSIEQATLEWVLGGNAPTPGTYYYATYQYWLNTSPGGLGDYVSIDSYVDPAYTDPAQQHSQAIAEIRQWDDGSSGAAITDIIDFRETIGDFPVNNTAFNVSYSYYLSRNDSVALSQTGQLIYYKGVPSETPIFPTIPPSLLPIAYLSMTGFSNFCNVITPNTKRFTVSDLWDIKITQESNLYYQALSNAETLAFITNPEPVAILVDPMIDFSRSQPLLKAMPQPPVDQSSNFSVWPEIGAMGLPQQVGIRQLYVNQAGSQNIKFHKNLATLGYVQVLSSISQTFSSATISPNPNYSFTPLCLIQVSPNQDNWFDTQNLDLNTSQRFDEVIPNEFSFLENTSVNQIQIQQQMATYNAFVRIRNSISRWWSGSSGITNWGGSQEIGSTVYGFQEGALGVGLDPQSAKNFDPSLIVPSTSMNKIDNKVVDKSVVPHVRGYDRLHNPITHVVSDVTFPPNIDNISITFDSVPVQATATVGFLSGTNPGTLKSDANGHFSGSIPVPSNVRTGRRVVLAQAPDVATSIGAIQASAIVASEGARQTDYGTFSTSGIVGTIQDTWSVDPIGQIITPDTSMVMTAVGLFFTAVPTYSYPTHATLIGTITTPFTVIEGTGDQMLIGVDQNVNTPTAVTLPSGPAVAGQDIVNAINQALGDTIASVNSQGQIVLTSPSLGSVDSWLALFPVANSAYTSIGFISLIDAFETNGNWSNTVFPVVIQVRDIGPDGFPSRSVLGNAVIPANMISPNVETICTFDDPVFLTGGRSYEIAILSDNPGYQLLVGQVGSTDTVSGTYLTAPNQFGPMVGSTNGVTWSLNRQMFLKMNVYEANFNQHNLPSVQGTITFGVISDLQINTEGPNGVANSYSKFNAIIAQMLPPGSLVVWSYSIDGINWLNFPVSVDVSMGTVPANLYVKADLVSNFIGSSSNVSLSPMIDFNHGGLGMMSLGRMNFMPIAYYYTNNVKFATSNQSTFLYVSYIANGPPANTAITPAYSVNNGVNWVNLVSPVILQLSQGYQQFIYETPITAFEVMVRLLITGDSFDVSKDPNIKNLEVVVDGQNIILPSGGSVFLPVSGGAVLPDLSLTKIFNILQDGTVTLIKIPVWTGTPTSIQAGQQIFVNIVQDPIGGWPLPVFQVGPGGFAHDTVLRIQNVPIQYGANPGTVTSLLFQYFVIGTAGSWVLITGTSNGLIVSN